MVETTDMADRDGQRWRVEVDSSICIGSGMCVAIAPEHFRFVGSRSQPVCELVEPDDDAVLDASESCPVEAIRVRDEGTGRVLAPGT